MRWILGFFLVAACQHSSRRVPAPKKLMDNPMTTLSGFYTALRNKEISVLSRYVDPQWGIYVIDCRGGALPGVDTLRSWDVVYKAIATTSPLPKLMQKKLPQVDCEKPMLYTESGAFVEAAYDGYLKHLTTLPDLAPPVRKWLEEKDTYIRLTVLDTHSHMWYYWGFRDKAWKLLCVRICPPCGA
ncbi:MAG: hypothetical protein ACUVRD_06725 [Bacteroidia bacterium]